MSDMSLSKTLNWSTCSWVQLLTSLLTWERNERLEFGLTVARPSITDMILFKDYTSLLMRRSELEQRQFGFGISKIQKPGCRKLVMWVWQVRWKTKHKEKPISQTKELASDPVSRFITHCCECLNTCRKCFKLWKDACPLWPPFC